MSPVSSETSVRIWPVTECYIPQESYLRRYDRNNPVTSWYTVVNNLKSDMDIAFYSVTKDVYLYILIISERVITMATRRIHCSNRLCFYSVALI